MDEHEAALSGYLPPKEPEAPSLKEKAIKAKFMVNKIAKYAI